MPLNSVITQKSDIYTIVIERTFLTVVSIKPRLTGLSASI
jgi:hypothetical protein